jgi:hypothetical protein
MQNVKTLNSAVHHDGDATRRGILTDFVLGHMLGNLKIFSCPNEINA